MAKGVRLASKSQIVSVAKLVTELAPKFKSKALNSDMTPFLIEGKEQLSVDNLKTEKELHQVMVRDSEGEPIKLANGENEWEDGDPYSFIQLDVSRKEFELKSDVKAEFASAFGAAQKGLLAKMKEAPLLDKDGNPIKDEKGKTVLKYPDLCDELVVKFTGGRGRAALDLGEEFDAFV